MKNQNRGGSSFEFTAASMTSLLKISLNFCVLIFLCSGIYAQQSLGQKKPGITTGLDGELEKTVRNTLKKNSEKLQLVENNGQSGLPREVVAYFSSYNEMVFIEKNKLRIIVLESDAVNDKKKNKSGEGVAAELADKKYHYNSFSILFKSSKGFSKLEKTKPFDTKRNFVSTNSVAGNTITAASYAEITLKNVYSGIDLRLYSQADGHLEFDWIVWPGYDAAKIKMKFEGQKSIGLSAKGSLEVRLGMGTFNMRLPESYYVTPAGKQNVDAKFLIAGNNEVHFKGINKRFSKYPLIIDPDLLWGTFFDGANTNFDEYLYAIEFNYKNNLIYCAGAASLQVTTAYVAALSNAYDSTFAATPDAFIYTLTKNGQFIMNVTYLGGVGADVAIGLALSNSFVYVCGYTSSADFPITKAINGKFEAFDTAYRGNNDGFIAIFDLTLHDLHYCSYLGGKGKDKALTVRALADSSYDISLFSTDTLPVINPNYIVNFADDVFQGNSEAWIGKFTSFSNLNFGTYVGGSSDDIINDFQVLSDGNIVFAGSTKQITEVKGTIPDNGSGQEALFGKINVPASGPVFFNIIDKIGGSGNDYGWGIYNIGDSVSIMVGQTSSSNFPLGSGTVFQNTSGGDIDGFIAKIYNNASAGYKASYTGGGAADMLVSVRPIIIDNQFTLLAFGSTASTNLATRNFNSGSFFSNTNAGGLDMMFVICDMNLNSKYYLSYIGGSANDYLGITGAPVGSNHLFFNPVDSVLYLGTTTHSSQTTHSPLFVGRGLADIANAGVPVFDSTKGNSNNDTHVVIAISTRGLMTILPLSWLDFKTQILSDCSARLSWKTANEDYILRYVIEKSTDGRNFEEIGNSSPGNGIYSFNDKNTAGGGGKIYYRIAAVQMNGKKIYGAVQLIHTCGFQNSKFSIYPTVIRSSFTISAFNSGQPGNIKVELIDAVGKRIAIDTRPAVFGSQTVYLHGQPVPGTYFVVLKDSGTGAVLLTQKVIISD